MNNTPVKVISSANGLPATERAYQLLMNDADTLDAVIEGISLVEDDPNETSVGYGGLPNEEGVVELEASVMHGPTHAAGAVAALRNIRHPARVAKLVMQQTDHELLVGDGAFRFAKAHGFIEENLLTEKARKIWLYWKQTRSDKDDWIAPPRKAVDPEVLEFFERWSGPATVKPSPPSRKKPRNASSASKRKPQGRPERPTGTIHGAAINAAGDISGVTSTSGLAFKIPGRVGDSAIVGAGLYVDNDIGSCGSTGRGEANLKNLSCFAGVELMRHGLSPEEAGLELLRRVARHTFEPRLLDDAGRPNFGLRFYLLTKNGAHAAVSMWGPADFAVTDAHGTRLEQCAYLFKRKE